MGNEVSQSQFSQLWNAKEFTELRTYNDPHYGDSKIIVNNQTNFLYAEVTRTLNQQSVYEQKLSECAFRKNLCHENLVRLVNYTSVQNDDFCSTFYKISQLYEYCPNDLKREISERAKNKRNFAEQELLNIIKGVVSVLRFLKEKGLSHHDVRPYTILISNEGVLKLSENLVYPKQLSGYQQLCMELIQDVYLAPKLLASLKERELSPNGVDVDKSDVFSLGMTVLEAATLQSVAGVYNMQEYIVSPFALDLMLKIVEQSYSPQFVTLLRGMLAVEEQARTGLEEVFGETERIIQQWGSQQQQQQQQQQSQQDLDMQPAQERTEVVQQQQQQEVEDQSQRQMTLDVQLTQQQQQQVEVDKQTNNTTTTTVTTITYQPVQIKLESPAKADLSKSFYSNYPAYPTAATNVVVQGNTDSNYMLDWQIKQQTFIDLDARINQVLQMSKETILKYGGPQAQRLYENETPFPTYTQQTNTQQQQYYPTTTTYVTKSPASYEYTSSYLQPSVYAPTNYPVYYPTTVEQPYSKFEQIQQIQTQSIGGSQISQTDPSIVQYKVSEVTTVYQQDTRQVTTTTNQQLSSETQQYQIQYNNVPQTEATSYTESMLQQQQQQPPVETQNQQQQQVEPDVPPMNDTDENYQTTVQPQEQQQQQVEQVVQQQDVQQEQQVIVETTEEPQQKEAEEEEQVAVEEQQVQPLQGRELIDISTKVNQVNVQYEGQDQEKCKRSKNITRENDDDLDKQIQKSIAKSREIEELIKTTRKALELEKSQTGSQILQQQKKCIEQEN